MPSAYYTSDSSTVWLSWANGSVTSAATTCETWATWTTSGRCYATGTTATTTPSVVWKVWATTGTTASGPVYVRADRSEVREPSAEEKAAAQKRHEESLERQRLDRLAFEAKEAKRKADEEAADKRAEELLVAALDAEQKVEYARDRSFHTRDRQGRRYRIRRAWSGHVTRVNDAGKETERFCIHPNVKVPLPDNQLLAKLMIEADEERFLKTANVTPLACALN